MEHFLKCQAPDGRFHGGGNQVRQLDAKERNAIRVHVNRRMTFRLYYPALCPDWEDADMLTLTRHSRGASAVQLADGVEWGSGFVEWDADAGYYELGRDFSP